MPKARIETAHGVVVLLEDQRYTFGRSRDCDLCLDADDTGISRLAGFVEFEHGTWWIDNHSTSRPLAIIDDLGFRSVLPPKRRVAVQLETQVIVEGTRGQHSLRIEVETPRRAESTGESPAGVPTAIGAEVFISAADRIAMVALFAGYLEDPPRYDPYPKSYAAAAARLGWRRTTLVKRIEYLRTRLDTAGVPNMKGFSALTNLAEYAISRGLITREDLELLRR
jgi:hypothetical protein